MSRFRKIVDQQSAHIATLRALIVALLALNAVLSYGWYTAPRDLTVHIPPDLRSGSIRSVGDVPPQSVYAFGFYIFQQLNHWPVDGEKDYWNRIHSLTAYLTPEFVDELKADFEAKKTRHELQSRQRSVNEVPGRAYETSRVKIESSDSWIVYLDLQVIETVGGQTIKNTALRYPLKIVRYDVNPELNPFGLALAGFETVPDRLLTSEEASR